MKTTCMLLIMASACAEGPNVAETMRAAMTANGRYLNGRYLNGRYLNGGDDLPYLVSCALQAGESIEIDGVAYEGGVGLAPEWAEGVCEEGCQRWLSACLLARVNAKGEHIEISMRGPTTALHPEPRELADFPREEGTYFGNLFAEGPLLWASSARADLALPRTCGESIDDCAIEVLGGSDDVCDGEARAQGRRACRDPDGTPWTQVITVYLR